MTPLLITAVVFVLLFLLTKGPLGTLVNARVTRGESRRMQDPIYALLRRKVELFGKELEALPYERLIDSEHLSRSEVVDGVAAHFSVETVDVAQDGDLWICIDATASAPDGTPLRRWHRWQVQPSYEFRKRKDGSVHY